MGRINTETHSKWECDICEAMAETSDHSHPGDWNRIAIGIYYANGDANIDWQNSWDGYLCGNCLDAKDGIYKNFKNERYAKPILKRIWDKVRGNK